jgi:DNA-binding MarR family transcriptional regulator
MGLVVRAPSKTSGREIAVALSDRGRRLVDRLIPLGRRYEEIASAGLSKQENVVLRRALRHMYRNLINAEPMAVKDRPAGSDAAIRPTSRPETPTI